MGKMRLIFSNWQVSKDKSQLLGKFQDGWARYKCDWDECEGKSVWRESLFVDWRISLAWAKDQRLHYTYHFHLVIHDLRIVLIDPFTILPFQKSGNVVK